MMTQAPTKKYEILPAYQGETEPLIGEIVNEGEWHIVAKATNLKAAETIVDALNTDELEFTMVDGSKMKGEIITRNWWFDSLQSYIVKGEDGLTYHVNLDLEAGYGG